MQSCNSKAKGKSKEKPLLYSFSSHDNLCANNNISNYTEQTDGSLKDKLEDGKPKWLLQVNSVTAAVF